MSFSKNTKIAQMFLEMTTKWSNNVIRDEFLIQYVALEVWFILVNWFIWMFLNEYIQKQKWLTDSLSEVI